VVLLQMDNKMKRDDFQEVLKLAQEGCRAVGQYMRGKLLERTQQLANARGAVQL
jgi:exosome complex component RRP41